MNGALSLPLGRSFLTYREEDRTSGNPQRQPLCSCLNCGGPGPGPLHTAQQRLDPLDPGYDQGSPVEVEESSPGL